MDCVNCKYADVSNGERTITMGNMTLCQKSNGVICTCDHIKSITITDGKMVCSEYIEREGQNNE